MREGYHYWILTNNTGQLTLIYGGRTEDEARTRGLEMLSGLDFEVKRLPTRNLARASSLLKGKRLEQTRSLNEATRRLSHKIPRRRFYGS